MFRYRYDTETELYYLQSRYYSPEWGRFINADGDIDIQGNLLSHNMFIYCMNNPVNMSDPSGRWSIWETIAVVTVAVVVMAVAPEIIPVLAEGYMDASIGAAVGLGITDGGVALGEAVAGAAGLCIATSSNEGKKDKEITEAGAPNSKGWKEAKKKIKGGKGKGVNVKARNEEEAEQLMNEVRPKLEKRPTYEPNPPKSGYEIHPVDNDFEMPHIKWRDWSDGKANGADGHIFWDNN